MGDDRPTRRWSEQNGLKNLFSNNWLLNTRRPQHRSSSGGASRWYVLYPTAGHNAKIEQGMVPLPKSVHPERIEENADVYGFEIDKEDVEALETDEYSPCTWDPTTEPL